MTRRTTAGALEKIKERGRRYKKKKGKGRGFSSRGVCSRGRKDTISNTLFGFLVFCFFFVAGEGGSKKERAASRATNEHNSTAGRNKTEAEAKTDKHFFNLKNVFLKKPWPSPGPGFFPGSSDLLPCFIISIKYRNCIFYSVVATERERSRNAVEGQDVERRALPVRAVAGHCAVIDDGNENEL